MQAGELYWKWNMAGTLLPANYYIDLTPVSFYNTRMGTISQFCAGFFRPDHDPPPAPAF
jgi:hypothetical protein